jgi:hypothetical protein
MSLYRMHKTRFGCPSFFDLSPPEPLSPRFHYSALQNLMSQDSPLAHTFGCVAGITRFGRTQTQPILS